MKRLLITGATGFIGSHFLKKAINQGWEITALCRANSTFYRVEEFRTKVDWIQVDAIDNDWREQLINKDAWNGAIHFATDYGRNKSLYSDVIQTNLILPLMLLEICIQKEIPVFINTDTCFPETYKYLQGYTVSKKQYKRWGHLITQGSKTRFITLELQHPFGPLDGKDKMIPWLIDQCRIPGNTIPMTSGYQKKDFVYVSDVVDAYICAVNNYHLLQQETDTIQIGSGKATTVQEIAEMINTLCGRQAILQFGSLPYRDGEIMHSEACLTDAKKIGWMPLTELSSGLMKTICRFDSH